MRAAYHGHLPVLETLIDRGADVNARDSGGLTALMVASHAGHQEVVTALLSRGAEGKSAARPKRRLVSSVIDETPEVREETRVLREAAVSQEAKVIETPEVNEDQPIAPPVRNTEVRTLQEPPEIWDLVHTTQPNFDSGPSVPTKGGSRRGLAFVVAGLILTTVALFGLLSIRNAETTTEAVSEQQKKPVTPQATRPSSGRAPLKPTGRIEGQRMSSPDPDPQNSQSSQKPTNEEVVRSPAPRAATVALSTKKSAAKPRNNATKSGSAFFSEDESVRTASGARGSSSKKDPVKSQAAPAGEPPKPSTTQKPKVIQWP
jgi:hypothetical protein